MHLNYSGFGNTFDSVGFFFFLLLNKKLEENRSAMPSGRQQHKTIAENTFKLTHKTIKRKKNFVYIIP